MRQLSRGYGPGVKPGRLRTGLVYFGLLEDQTERERLDDAPMNAWRWLAVVLVSALGVAVTIAALALFGVAPTWDDAVGVIVVVLGASLGAGERQRRRRRS
jgi:hypothetical protein